MKRDIYARVETKRLVLRQLKEESIDDIFRQFSDPDMCRYLSDPPCDIEGAKQIIKMYQHPDRDPQLRLGLFSKIDGSFIGTCGYHQWDKNNWKVEIGYDIWKEYWRQGYMSEDMLVLLDICFDHLKVECVYAYTHPKNKASVNLLKSFGFHLDGVLRSWVRCGNEQQDQNCLTLLANEWRGELSEK